MSNVIEVRNLKKYFGDVKAVDDVTFRVKRGELFAFLGLNGAGKSTTISILCSQLRKDAGEVIVDGADVDRQPDQVKRKIGVVFQTSCLDQLLSVRDNLKTRAALYGVTGPEFTARLRELTGLLRLEELLRRPVGKLSGGQRRRIDIARAMLHQPEILILDEPTTGLDPQTRRMVWDVIAHLRKERGLTVFLTTHYMEEAAEADYVVILDGGHVAAEGTPLDLKNTYSGDYIKLYKVSPARLEELGLPFRQENGCLQLAVPHTADAKKLILQHPELFQDFEVVKGRMDDVFLAATGKELKEEAHA